MRKLDTNEDGRLTSEEVRPPRFGKKGGRKARTHDGPLPESTTLGAGAREKRILGVPHDLDQRRIGMMNVPAEDGRLLRLLVAVAGAEHVVEIGTSNGYSGLWICMGLLGTRGRLTTYEFDAHRASLARSNFQKAGVDHFVTLIEGDAHEAVTKLTDRIDLLFLDADKEGYLDYLEKLLPQVRPGGLVVAHNMRRPPPDPQFIEAITTNPQLETVFLNMHEAGIAVTLRKRPEPEI